MNTARVDDVILHSTLRFLHAAVTFYHIVLLEFFSQWDLRACLHGG